MENLNLTFVSSLTDLHHVLPCTKPQCHANHRCFILPWHTFQRKLPQERDNGEMDLLHGEVLANAYTTAGREWIVG